MPINSDVTVENDGDAAAAGDGQPDISALGCRTRLVVRGSAAADVVLRTGAAALLSTALAPWALSAKRRSWERDELEFYRDLAATNDLATIFPRPHVDVEIASRGAGPLAFRAPGGQVELLRFESPFVAVNPDLRERYAGFGRNRIAWAQYWRHDDGPRPTLCVIHGFMASPYWLNSAFFSLPWFYGHGYDVLLFTLPFHGLRQHPLAPFRGRGYFAYGLAHLNEAMAHAVHDFRLFLDHLEGRGVTKFGLTGISLGGYTTALLAAVEERLHLAIPIVPVTDIVDVGSEWFPASLFLTGTRLVGGITVDEIRDGLAMHSPLRYAPRLPKDRLMIVGGLGDRLAPPSHSQRLWEHWDECRLHWFPGNHALHINQGAYLKEMGRFMLSTGFND